MRRLSFLIVLLLAAIGTPNTLAQSQAPSSDRIEQIINQAESRYKEGELHLKAGERLAARDKFDKAIDTILESSLNVRSHPRLQAYYLELVERIYKLEVPQEQKRPHSLLPIFGKQPKPREETKCTLTTAQAPALRGLRLGMTTDEVVKSLGAMRVNYLEAPTKNEFGWLRTTFRPHTSKEFEGVRQVALRFLDSKLTSISLEYDSNIKWDNIAQLREKITEALKLPDAWESTSDFFDDVMGCDGFEIKIELFGAPRIQMLDYKEQVILKQRERAKQEKQRESFKP